MHTILHEPSDDKFSHSSAGAEMRSSDTLWDVSRTRGRSSFFLGPFWPIIVHVYTQYF